MPELEIPTVNPGIHHAWHLYILRLHLEKLTINRNAFFDELRKRGICCSVHFIPLHLMPYYRKTYGYRPGDFPEAEQQFERVISLPLFPALTDAEVERIIVAVRQVVAESLKRKT
jgi:dTDP-4-amino-4,6-dideoxygalactose transaminase